MKERENIQINTVTMNNCKAKKDDCIRLRVDEVVATCSEKMRKEEHLSLNADRTGFVNLSTP